MTKKKTGIWNRYGLWKSLWNETRLVWRLFKDPRVPVWLKLAFPIAGIAYVLFPLDIIPDIIPVVGELDDLMIVLMLMRLFVALTPEEIVREVETQLFGKKGTGRRVINGRYRVID